MGYDVLQKHPKFANIQNTEFPLYDDIRRIIEGKTADGREALSVSIILNRNTEGSNMTGTDQSEETVDVDESSQQSDKSTKEMVRNFSHFLSFIFSLFPPRNAMQFISFPRIMLHHRMHHLRNHQLHHRFSANVLYLLMMSAKFCQRRRNYIPTRPVQLQLVLLQTQFAA